MNPDNPAPLPPAEKPDQPARAPDAVREGSYLVVRKRGAKLPPGCVICNLPETKRILLTVRKFNLPLGGPILLLSPILLFMYAVAPTATFEAGLCPAHLDESKRLRRPRLKFLGILLAMFALGLTVSFWPMGEIVGGILIAGSLLLLPVAALVALWRRPLLKAHYSDRRYMWVDGISPKYLEQLPEIGGKS